VVFDVLRATTSMLAALSHGAAQIFPVKEISEALALQRGLPPPALLAGERDGLRIRAAQTGGGDFDLGNSPREFTPERVAGRDHHHDHHQRHPRLAGLPGRAAHPGRRIS
jgi:2-phosphosulfolactate phosphatase